MPKNKLKKFAEINSFPNVIQPKLCYDDGSDFRFKGQWNHACFGNKNPIILEVGCGKGEYTVSLGKAYPQHNFIGIDIKGDRIWKGAKDALNKGLQNVAFLRTQAEHINTFFGEKEISGIWLTFPDPQEKKARTKKRLTSPSFLERYHKILIPNSPIHLKTDNQLLFDYTLYIIREKKHRLLACIYDLYSDNSEVETLLRDIQTYYEKIFLKEGKAIHYLKFSLNDGKSYNSSFFEKVYAVVRQIPRGRVTSYGAIASHLGSRGSSRMVGWAMNHAHKADPSIPAHRVVNRLGRLTGKHHFGSSTMMQQLLENENIQVIDDEVVRFEQRFWDPSIELYNDE